jgi:formimidoylglutamase
MKIEIDGLLVPFQPDGSRHDSNDLLQSDVSHFTTEKFSEATHVVIGCPQDHGVLRNQGRPGAAEAPAAIRSIFYRLKPPEGANEIRLIDLGDVQVDGVLEDIHFRLQSVVAYSLAAGKSVIVLGGGNDISFADGAALAETFGEIVCLNLDAHLDIRKSPSRNSGTPYRNLLDQDLIKPTNLFEVGIQPWANSSHYLDEARNLGIHIKTLGEIHKTQGDPWDLIANLPHLPLLAGLDMDCVRSSDAPGASAPSPVGFSAEEILAFVDRVREHPAATVFEISEVNPVFDLDSCTSRLAALAVYTFLYGLRA